MLTQILINFGCCTAWNISVLILEYILINFFNFSILSFFNCWSYKHWMIYMSFCSLCLSVGYTFSPFYGLICSIVGIVIWFNFFERYFKNDPS
jgi:hypothetical protein